MNAHSSHIGSGLTADPKDTELFLSVVLKEFALIYGSNSQLSLHGSNSLKRRKYTDKYYLGQIFFYFFSVNCI